MIKSARVARDLCLIGVGVLGFVVTPPSLQHVGVYGVLSNVWAAMMLGGAIASLYGVLRRAITAEIYGCSFVGGAFFIWCLAALIQPNPTPTSYMVALVFLSGTAGQFYRVGMIASQRVIR